MAGGVFGVLVRGGGDGMIETCVVCKRETIEISFKIGYGSVFDMEDVCWDCASDLDEAIKALQEKKRPALHVNSFTGRPTDEHEAKSDTL